MTTWQPTGEPGFPRPCASPARPPRSAPGPLAPPSAGTSAPAAHLRAAACLALALLAAALPAFAAKPVLRATNPIIVEGTLIKLHFDQALIHQGPTSAYTVKVGGNSFTPTLAELHNTGTDTDAVRLAIGFAIAPDETVTVQYDKPTSGNLFIQNSANEGADSIAETTATNTTTTNPWSTVAVSSAVTSLSGTTVGLNFSGRLAGTTGDNPVTPPPASAYTVTVDGTAQTPGASTYIPNPGNTGKSLVALTTLPTPIKSGQTVQVSYAPPLGTSASDNKDRLLDTSFKLVQRFTNRAVTNTAPLVGNLIPGSAAERRFSSDYAQAFTTGDRATRLTAAHVRLSRDVGGQQPSYAVRIHASDDSGTTSVPGASLGTLTNPASLAEGAGNRRFAAPTGAGSEIDLAANTTYFVVLDVTGATGANTSSIISTNSNDQDANATTGWSIADNALTRSRTSSGSFSPSSTNQARRIAVSGNPVAPTLASAAVNGTALTLTFNAKLATGSAPAGSAFTVSGGRTGTGTVTINASDPKVVSVTLDSAVARGQTVTVSYAKPAGSPLKDTGSGTGALAAIEVANFSGQAVKNNTPVPSLVSNTGQTAASGSLEIGGSSNWANALTFTTGGNALGYTLSSVDVTLAAGTPLATTRVSIYETTGTPPAPTGSSVGLHVLNNPSSLTASATNTFTAAAGATLAANTTYAVVVDRSSGSGSTSLAKTTSNAEDSGATSGWSIGDKRHFRQGAGSWSEATDAEKLQIAIRGLVVQDTTPPAFSSAAVNGTALTVTFTKTLDTNSLPAGSRFTLAGGTPGTQGTGTVSVNGATASVTLNHAVSHGTTVTLSYSKPTSNPLQDAAGNDVATFSGQTVKNNTPAPVLVGNTGKTASGVTVSFGMIMSTNLSVGQLFTTGGNTAGYTLSAVDAVLHTGGASPNVQVSIYTTSGSPPAPDSSLHVLNNPSSLTDGATNTFTADAGASLDANTTYAVVFEVTSGADTPSLAQTDSDNEDSGGATGWSIANKRHLRQGTGSWTQPSGSGVPLIAIRGTAKTLVITPPNTQNPQGQSGGSEQRPRDPQRLQLALWTDKPGYRPGETVRLYRSLEPHDDRGRYRAFAWLERAGGGERQWLAPLSAEGQLHAEAVDSRGQPASAAAPQALSAADRELAFEGPAPEPGLWQFVLELRPGEPSEQAAAPAEPLRTRRAWAKFAVAERSVLLNRSGFDREIRSDMTLRADTLYYLGHQLFVHAGATLAIEPGTLLQAFGSHAAIIVEPGGRIVAEGTREAPVVLTCSAPAGYRQPGCWAGLRILGRAPVTRLEGVAPGVLPPERPAYGGSDAEGSSGVLRYVRVEFAGASGNPEEAAPAIGLYGAGSGTVLDHVQARSSLGDGFAFHGGTAACDHCVASGSGSSGLSWQRGWQGGAAHLYVQHGRGGGDGLSGGHDPEGHDREPRSLPTLSNVTLVHSAPYDRRTRRAVAVRLADGTGVQLRDLLAAHFGGGALRASGRSRLLFGEGESTLSGALLWLNGSPQVPAGIAEDADFAARNPKLRDVRDFAAPDPRPKADSPALTIERKGYIGAFGRSDNWLKEWTVFGPESLYDIRQRDEEAN